MTVRRAAFVLGVVAVGAVAWLVRVKEPSMWPFENDKRLLADLLGPKVAPWLDHAKIAAWTPDVNARPQAYFAVRPCSEEDFRGWAQAADLRVETAPGVPSGIFVLPDGVNLTPWLPHLREGAAAIDAQGSTSRFAIWSRWQDGTVYIVVHPMYEP